MSDLYEKYLALAKKLKIPEPDLLTWVVTDIREENEKKERIRKDEEKVCEEKAKQQAIDQDERARERELELDKKRIELQTAQWTSASISHARLAISMLKLKFAPLLPSGYWEV
ncbi:hypothetical protein ElyMa_002956800 [Elysia marginata]|uniref:Uncharacterized protein n=1 Tax=Elysia marginata TaxID=1093978 RepID=A0AAV4I793_9GAST|nr:hypothetical protein ElyMa_002956800 [Elysia marginata]